MNNIPNDIKIAIILAIVLMVVIVLFLLFIMVLYSRRQVLFEKEKQLRDVEYEKQILKNEIDFQKKTHNEQERISHDLHDDVGSGITALKLQTEYLKNKNKDLQLDPNIEELLETCEELHISMRQILWNLKVGDDNIENFTQRTAQYTQSFFSKTNIQVHIFKNNIGYDQLSADTRRNVFLCLKEILNNAYKHSKCQNIELHFNQIEDFFTIDVIDDGVGMNSTSAFGYGFENMKARMTGLNGDFKIVPVLKGLQVHLSIDLQKEINKIATSF